MTSYRYEYAADVLDTTLHYNTSTGEVEPLGWLPLPVVGILPSVDKDRVPYAMATLDLGPLTADMIALLDPRKIDPSGPPPVRWRVAQYTLDGQLVDTFPARGEWAAMWPRSLSRTLTDATLNLAGGETLIDDKINLDGEADILDRYNTPSRHLGTWETIDGTPPRVDPTRSADEYGNSYPAYSWAALVQTGLRYVFGDDPDDKHARDVLIDRATREALGKTPAVAPHLAVGQSVLDLIETELSAQNLRLYDVFGTWWVSDRDHAPGSLEPDVDEWTPPNLPPLPQPRVVSLSSYADPGLPADVDPSITDLSENLSRDGGWADGVLVRFSTDDGSRWWHQLAVLNGSPACPPRPTEPEPPTWDSFEDWLSDPYRDLIPAPKALQTRGQIFDVPFTPESADMAQTLLARTIRKGREVEITARARLDVIPGVTLRAYLRDELIEAVVSAVEWNFPSGTMRVHTQSAVSVEPPSIASSERSGSTPTAATRAEVEALASSIPTNGDVRRAVQTAFDTRAERYGL